MGKKQVTSKITIPLTRTEAIEHGILIDLMDPEFHGIVKKLGFDLPIAITYSASSADETPTLRALRTALAQSESDVPAVHFYRRDESSYPMQMVCIGEKDERRRPVLTIMTLQEYAQK